MKLALSGNSKARRRAIFFSQAEEVIKELLPRYQAKDIGYRICDTSTSEEQPVQVYIIFRAKNRSGQWVGIDYTYLPGSLPSRLAIEKCLADLCREANK